MQRLVVGEMGVEQRVWKAETDFYCERLEGKGKGENGARLCVDVKEKIVRS